MKKSILTIALSVVTVFAATAGKDKDLRIKLKEKTLINVELTQQNKVYSDPEKLEVVMNSEVILNMVVNVAKASKEQVTFNTKIDRVRLKQNMQGMEVNLDTKDGEPEDDQMAAMAYGQIKPMLDTSVNATVSNKGKVIEEDENEMGISSQTLYIELPEGKIGEGYTWSHKEDNQPEMEYKVVKMTKKEVIVSINTKEKMDEVEDVEPQDSEEIDMTMTGSLTIDAKTGVVTSYEATVEAETTQQGQVYYTVQKIKSVARY